MTVLNEIWRLEDDELVAYHERMHQLIKDASGPSERIIVAIHDSTAREMVWRGLGHSSALTKKGIKITPVYTTADVPYSPEDEYFSYVIHRHWRGDKCHLDWRFQWYDTLEGWRVDDQEEEVLPQKIVTIREAVRWHNLNIWKIDWQAGRIKSDLMASGVRKTKKLLAQPLDWSSTVWLNFSGVIDEEDGDQVILHIVDSGRVEYGAQKSDSREVFLTGGIMHGRWLFRHISSDEDGYWILMQPAGAPYVLSDRAIESDWLPGYGVSALPGSIRSQVPDVYKYWEESRKIAALEKRNKLAQLTELYAGDKYKLVYIGNGTECIGKTHSTYDQPVQSLH